MSDFNVGPENTYIKGFCDNYDLTNLIKEPKCFKNPEIITYIDLILTIRPRSLQNYCVISDIHCNEKVIPEI